MSSASAAVDGGFWKWNSPIPYLFGGLTLMLGLIAVALVVLACSYQTPSTSTDPSRDPEDQAAPSNDDDKPAKIELEDNVPKIVVIMPGHENPTFLAKLASSSKTSHNGCQQA
ncbi:protein GLUTAMINE DUMPER 2-like [Rhodamnia argentea]|uniref:Protein GLUTAMINE DUMPER 2-like n=1 Tax=Rhodamnia argentea TaxID=178133 RepID=A0A8B8QWY7_9MYRT|nr:protein GLUTAMINE DUMPER 2-like [Rhodamnia argentea]